MRRLLLTAFVWLTPAFAWAGLTTPVPEFEPALNQAWATDPACGGLLVDDLAARDGGLTLTTTRPLTLHLVHHGDAPVCSAGPWQVTLSGQAGPDSVHCAQLLCQLLPRFDAALELARRPGGSEEAMSPFLWPPPRASATGLVWLLCTLAALLLPLALMGRRRSPAPLLPLLGLALAGLAVRWWLMRHAPLCRDELGSWGFVNLWREFDGREIPNNPPLYRLLAFPVSLFTHGDPLFGRINAVLLGGALVFTVGLVGSVFASPAVGLIAAGIAAVHPGLALATIYHRSYSTLVVWSALSLLATSAAVRSTRARDRYLATALWTGTILAHYFGVGIVLGMFIWVWCATPRRRDWVGPVALVLLLVAPFVPAVLLGAARKATDASPLLGWTHAGRLAWSIPAVLGGFVTPMLESTISETLRVRTFVALDLLCVGAILLGWRRVAPRLRWGLLLALVGGAALPVLIAPRVGGVREFQALSAAVPMVVFIAAALVGLPGRGLRVITGVGLVCWLGVEVHRAPTLVNASDEAVAQDIRGHPAPSFVWPPDTFFRLAPRFGLKREETELWASGRDASLRTLRACSTAALREAATVTAGPIRVISVDNPCGAAALNGRGVSCTTDTSIASDVLATTCQVDPSTVPRRPSSVAVAGARHITPGHEQLFVDAALPYRLGQPVKAGVVLSNIRVRSTAVEYELTEPGAPPVNLSATWDRPPTASVDEARLDAPTHDAIEGLREALRKHLTASAWSQALVEVSAAEEAAVQATTPRSPLWWIPLSAVAALALLLDLLRLGRFGRTLSG